jgi:hypothetical protein
MSDADSFVFLSARLPSWRRCGLAETVGLCFVDSNCATSVFVLGLVCVCEPSEKM